MLLSAAQRARIREIIRRVHTAVIATVVGPDVLSEDELASIQGRLPETRSTVTDAYLEGQVTGLLNEASRDQISIPELERRAADRAIPMTSHERRAIDAARQTAAEHIRNLSARVETSTGRVLTVAEQQDAVRDHVATALERRQTIQQLKSTLGKQHDEWNRDWTRVANTELHNARQLGQAAAIQARHGSDQLVFKRPAPDACRHCLKLHIGSDGQPRIFRLSTLQQNGTNVGRKAAEWKAVIGGVHAHCRCELFYMPSGWGFNDNGEMVPDGELGEVYEDEEDVERAMELEDDLRKSEYIGALGTPPSGPRFVIPIQKALTPEQGASTSIMGHRNVTAGSGGPNMIFGADLRKPPGHAIGHPVLTIQREPFEPRRSREDYNFGDPLLTAKQLVVPVPAPVDVEEMDDARERLDEHEEKRAEASREGPFHWPLEPGEEAEAHKAHIGTVVIKALADRRIAIKTPGRDFVEFETLNQACDHVWAMQKGFASVDDWRKATGQRRVPSGAGWKFFQLHRRAKAC